METAIKKNCEIKENYFINALHSNKFNITLTKAYTEITRHFMENSSVKTFDKLLKEITKKWPDVIFMDTVSLAELINK